MKQMCIYTLRIIAADGISEWAITTISKKLALEFLEKYDQKDSSLELKVYTEGGKALWNISGTTDSKLIYNSLAAMGG